MQVPLEWKAILFLLFMSPNNALYFHKRFYTHNGEKSVLELINFHLWRNVMNEINIFNFILRNLWTWKTCRMCNSDNGYWLNRCNYRFYSACQESFFIWFWINCRSTYSYFVKDHSEDSVNLFLAPVLLGLNGNPCIFFID
jgi:hypothetical protein